MLTAAEIWRSATAFAPDRATARRGYHAVKSHIFNAQSDGYLIGTPADDHQYHVPFLLYNDRKKCRELLYASILLTFGVSKPVRYSSSSFSAAREQRQIVLSARRFAAATGDSTVRFTSLIGEPAGRRGSTGWLSMASNVGVSELFYADGAWNIFFQFPVRDGDTITNTGTAHFRV